MGKVLITYYSRTGQNRKNRLSILLKVFVLVVIVLTSENSLILRANKSWMDTTVIY